MSGLLLALPFVLLAIASLIGAWRMRQRLLAAEQAAVIQSQAAAARDRTLGQLTREMQSLGLALMAHAGGGLAPAAAASATAAEARRLLHLADELSEFLAAEAGPRVLRPEPLTLLPVLEEAVAAASAQLGPGRRHWQLAPEFGALVLHAAARALRGAVQQVLARAARTTRDGDWIGLRPVLTPDSLAIVVEDEGAGLPAEDIAAAAPVAATVLVSAPEARTRGLGFGLAVARALLEAHGGSLRIEATRGIGARAWLTLPRERRGAAPAVA